MLNKKDQDHVNATDWSKSYTGQVITTEWVLIESADGLASSKQRGIFAKTRQKLLSDAAYRVIPLDMRLYDEGLNLYTARLDKEWSLTDCISFVAMQRENITEALTGDRHFEQAGFTALLK